MLRTTSDKQKAVPYSIFDNAEPCNNMASEIDSNTLAKLVAQADSLKKTVIVDCRCFIDYNISHIRSAVNAFYSKMMRRRLYENKVCSNLMLSQLGQENKLSSLCLDLVLYSEDDENMNTSPSQALQQQQAVSPKNCVLPKLKRKCPNNADESPLKFLYALSDKFKATQKFNRVIILKDGFGNFRKRFPDLCESSSGITDSEQGPCDMTLGNSLSQPCISATSDGPTEILPFMYLGSQQDALDPDLLRRFNIKYVINLSVNCPQPESVTQDGHFMRIPVNDSYQEKLLPHFEEAFKFLDKVCQRESVVLIHCLAGISRSPTLAIAYIMRLNKWTSEQAYRFVKEKRPSISPNFNFMGQLLEYESKLREEYRLSSSPGSSDCTSSSSASFPTSSSSSSDSNSSSSPNTFENQTQQKHSQRQQQNENSIKIAKSASCDHISLFSGKIARPQSFWDNDLKEPSSKMNENGKRVMESTTNTIAQQPTTVPTTTTTTAQQQQQQQQKFECQLDRPRALEGLKARKALNVPPTCVGTYEELPSPSNELEKLHFAPSPSDLTASNPFFSAIRPTPTTTATSQPSTSSQILSSALSVENPTFQQQENAIEKPTITTKSTSYPKSVTSCGSMPRFFDRLTNHLKRGLWPSSSTSSSSASSSSSSSSTHHQTTRVLRSSTIGSLSTSAAPHACSLPSVPEVSRSHSDFAIDQDSPESGFAEDSGDFRQSSNGDHSGPYCDPDRESISSASSIEIVVK